MDLQLGLALPNATADHDHLSDGRPGINLDLNMGIGSGHNIHQFCDDAEGRVVSEDMTRRTVVPRTLPLLQWGGREGKGCDEDEYMDTDSSSYHQSNRERETTTTTTTRRVSGGNWNYVKVAMEGIGIWRKVDLSIHHSFHQLKDTLLPMFGIYNEDSDNYKLAYQDWGGHWLIIADDSSWWNFVRSAQRLKIVKI